MLFNRGTDKELLLMGKLYKIQDNQSEKTHVKRAQRYRSNEGESSQYYDKRYTLSETMSLFTINVTDEVRMLSTNWLMRKLYFRSSHSITSPNFPSLLPNLCLM